MSTTDGQSDLLAALVRADVDFIVVGGMAAVLHGAPITTHDLDIVVGPSELYDELLDRTVKFSDGDSEFRVLSLEALIEIKSKTDRAKDRLVLAELIATLSETTKKK